VPVVRAFVCSYVRMFVCSYVHAFMRACVCSCVRVFVCSCVLEFVCSSSRAFVRSVILSIPVSSSNYISHYAPHVYDLVRTFCNTSFRDNGTDEVCGGHVKTRIVYSPTL